MHLLYITAKDKNEALELAHSLVGEELIACANVIDNMTSVYRWQSEVETGEEVILICKTVEANISAIVDYIKRHHSYDLPCVMAFKVDNGNPDFLKWVENSCKVAY